jgi:hypothetical protein
VCIILCAKTDPEASDMFVEPNQDQKANQNQIAFGSNTNTQQSLRLEVDLIRMRSPIHGRSLLNPVYRRPYTVRVHSRVSSRDPFRADTNTTDMRLRHERCTTTDDNGKYPYALAAVSSLAVSSSLHRTPLHSTQLNSTPVLYDKEPYQ